MSFPSFTNLRVMVGELEEHSIYKPLSNAIRQSLVAQSCIADIKQSLDCCKALRAMLPSPRKINTIERGAIESSLLANAVMLYARATATAAQKGERGAIQIYNWLTVAQKADHNILVGIRNRALAHVYTAEAIGGALWHDELMFAVEIDGRGWRPASGSKRVQFDKKTLERLERQLPVAHALVRSRFEKRIDAVTHILNSGPLPLDVFEAHRFDPVQHFGSPQAVQQIIDGIAIGESSVLV